MTPERWKQIEDVFQAAIDLPSGERRKFIAEACGGDEDLRAQVEVLITQHDEAGDFIESPAFAATGFRTMGHSNADTLMTESFDDPSIGRSVGAYKIVREIGRGGMGAVYLAERADSEFRRRVAIKLIKRGMDTDFILRRFRKERQILASLDHPNIARLLDGGTSEDGLPYFVMEYIEGLPIYRFCDERKLKVAERLRLFQQVCDAVHYAHRHLVIHRDIKPSNILVTSESVPKLLDFGIAKLLNPELADITFDPTATAMRLMTPEYASPEQVQGQAVTATSDVYSLGVLLYELLTGHRPYSFLSRAPHEIARVICEERPTNPSVVITRPYDLLPAQIQTSETTTLNYLYWSRNATPESLQRELAGDLDSIVMKALCKDQDERYQSVEHLREDITHHLEGRPVSAPAFVPTTIYSTAPSSSEASTGQRSIAVLPLKVLDARHTEDTGDDYLGVGLADALITRLSSVHRFVVRPTSSVLRYQGDDVDPLKAGRQLGADFIITGTIRIAGERIRVSAQLLNVKEGATRWAGKFDENYTDVLSLEDSLSEQVSRALVPQLTGDERRQLSKRGTDKPDAYEAYLRGRYHWTTLTEDSFAKAITSYYSAIAIDPEYAAAYAAIAEYHCWLAIFGVLPPDECLAAAREAAHRAVELDDTLAEGHTALGFALLAHPTQWETAKAHHLRAIELNPNYATAYVWLAGQLAMEGRFDEADAEMRRACELDPLNPFNTYNRVWYLYQAQRFEESIRLARNLIRSDPRYGPAYFALCWSLRRTGAYAEAIEAARKAVEFGGDTPQNLATLGAAYAEAGRSAEARSVLAELDKLATKRFVTPYHRALIHLNLGERDEALALLEQSVEQNEPWIVWLGVEPQFDSLRSDSRFRDLLQKTGNPAPPEGWLVRAATAPTQVAAIRSQPDSTPSGGRADSSAQETRFSNDGEAQQLYNAGRYFATRRTAEGLRQAIERLEHAVERDPRFALAYAELADCYSLLNWYVEPPPAEAWERARHAALKAVEADEQLTDAHASLGFVKLHYDHDFTAAESEFRRAIELKPENQVARRWHSFNLSAMGRHEEAVSEIRRAQEISPRSPVIATAFANVLFFAQRYDEAIEQCRRALELDPGSLSSHIILRWSYEWKGMCDEALAVYEQERAFAGDTPNTRAKRAHVLATCGRSQEAREILTELVAGRGEQWVTAYELAVIYSILNERDEAFKWIEQAEEENAVGLTYARVDPRINNLRADPRFDELLQRMNRTVDTPQGDGVNPGAGKQDNL
jgi:serine/threonine protein kinase/tetratricopeptide (TPR) repeat protein